MFNPNAAWARTEALRADRERKHYRQTERGNITGRQGETERGVYELLTRH